MSPTTAEVNHLRPVNRQCPSPSCQASVSVLPTSEPPASSVIHWPESQNVETSREVRRGTAWAINASLAEALSAVAAPSVMASGQV
ncbi:MAG: hypothetical protein BWZ07_03298 [Alphaproteobacteria bacterium ADurb.BinA280]|nr:MAG: hypothetical protein BWZ07_03298 [Alphaproteobacteria bacterium ADurb.BinA280]